MEAPTPEKCLSVGLSAELAFSRILCNVPGVNEGGQKKEREREREREGILGILTLGN